MSSRDDKFVAGTTAAPVRAFVMACTSCRHRDRERPYACAAFPEGIPEEIRRGQNDHTRPYPGDNGIRYERETRAP